MVKITVWLQDEQAETVEQIREDERRGSVSNTVQALVGEAIDAREEKAKRDQKAG